MLFRSEAEEEEEAEEEDGKAAPRRGAKAKPTRKPKPALKKK